VGLVGAHAVTHQLRRAVGNAQVLVQGLGVASYQIVFDAAARYRANGATVLAQGHHGAHWAWGRAPGAHHGGQQGVLAGRAPVTQCLEYQDVDIVHCLLSLFLSLAAILKHQAGTG